MCSPSPIYPHMTPYWSRIWCVTVLLAALLGASAATVDPRPQVLVIGDMQSLPMGSSPSWVQIVAERHPEWNVQVNADSSRLLGNVSDGMDALLTPYGKQDAVIIFLGINDARNEAYAVADATRLTTQMTTLLTALQRNTKTQGARLALVTPVPVIEARLDAWSKDTFAGGETRSDAIADGFSRTAALQGATVIDLHKWVKAQRDDAGAPGKLLGNTGWIIRESGQPALADFLEGEIVKRVTPQPRDAAAFTSWQRELQFDHQLDRILSYTSAGLVAHGNPLDVATSPTRTVATVPADALSGNSVELLVMATDAPFAAVAMGNDDGGPTLTVHLADKGAVVIPLPAQEWRLLDEAHPDQRSDPLSFADLIGVQRDVAPVSNVLGKRVWLVLRFPLDALNGRAVTSAALTMQPAPLPGLPAEDLGSLNIFPISGPDRDWSRLNATWNTRDGAIGWTGGAVNAPVRKRMLEELWYQGPPPGTATRIKEELGKLDPDL
jgi:lysophospholipase L1-like esterase